MHKSKTFEELNIGDSVSKKITLDEALVEAFARATADYNPIHMDEDYAQKTPFGGRIAHGVLLTGIISGILGTELPGLGTVARNMDAKFSRPAYIGDTITAKVKLVKKTEKLKMCEFRYTVVNQEGQTLVRGRALVIPKTES